jgi:hypothetical protein
MKVDPRKIAAVKDWDIPSSVTQLRSFLGLATYFRRFIRGFSQMAAPLHALTRKDSSWSWSPACDAAFNAIKHALTHAPCLGFPDFTKPFEVRIYRRFFVRDRRGPLPRPSSYRL